VDGTRFVAALWARGYSGRLPRIIRDESREKKLEKLDVCPRVAAVGGALYLIFQWLGLAGGG